MAHKRFFVEKISPETILTGEEYSHAKNVLRIEAGEEIVLLDGSGKEYCAIVNEVKKKEIVCRVVSERANDKECKTSVTLLCGALKGDKTELVVQKATELGVKRIGVFSSKYCSAYMNENKLERLNKVAREAAKQCLRAAAPEVVYFSTLEEALLSAQSIHNKIFACEFARRAKSICTVWRAIARWSWAARAAFPKKSSNLRVRSAMRA